MAKSVNEDGGYDHFHEHGRKTPGALAKGFPDKRAAHSGNHTLGKQTGMEPDEEVPPMPNVTPVGS
jgi:hypothetical protein